MRTKDIIITFTVLALCCFASSCAKQNDFDSFKGETDSHLSTVEGQMTSLKELTATLGEEQATLKVYAAALGVGFEKYATEVDSLLKVLDKRLDAAEAVIPTLAGMSYVESTFATLEVVDSLSKVAAAIAVKVQADSTALAGSIKSKTEASKAELMKIFDSYYTMAEIDAKIKVLSEKLDTLFSDMDTAVFKHIEILKKDVKNLGTSTTDLARKLDDDVAALKDRDTVFLKQIDSLDNVYADTLVSLATIVSADSARIEDLKARVGKLEARIQSVRVVPDYSDGKVDMMKAATKIKFDVCPASAAEALVEKKQTSIFSFQIVEALASTKAGIYTDVEVDSVKMSGEDSLLVLFVNGADMPQPFFDTTKLYNARLRIHDGGSDCSSSYFALNPPPKYPEAPDQPCIKIAGIWWASVNCGYHATDYKYGKLYQWGRKYGCGYGEIWTEGSTQKGPETIIQTTSTTTTPIAAENEDALIFYKINPSTSPINDWLTPQDSTRWNSNTAWPGKETSPERTEYDPCPTGWRVPTKDELTALLGSHRNGGLQSGTGVHIGMNGKWFDGSTAAEPTSGVFLPAAGYRLGYNGNAISRGSVGYYWSSAVNGDMARHLYFTSSFAYTNSANRPIGYSVRCVYCGNN